MKNRILLAALTALLAMPAAHAETWCQLLPGWSVVTNGTLGDNAFILGHLQGAPSDIWIQIASAQVGKANIAMALSAQLAGRTLSIYIDNTCDSFPSWAPMGMMRLLKLD